MNPWILLLPVLLIVAVLLCWRIIRRRPVVGYRVSPDGVTHRVMQGNRRMTATDHLPHTIIGQGEYARHLHD